ncbi:C4-dicarboxylic acid transporter DauA [Lujinxingia litoralis]|uniref:C4-dicarboxylic acid transporter DauA n=1 Tax=Lujinxingia litoralis TaxID=2211119 RepID=A0A328C822_9DELT|nr:C4-dicarboxylic acid transporter DauA [Lujinxingia litoralis]RAL22978.1 C4-dicarboxylic acid transporter DauA [Lujinxingia litoralis]
MGRTRYTSLKEGRRTSELPAAALRAVWREGYGAGDLRADVMAGLVVGVVALPLAMALAIGVGVAPQYGLYTSIVAGFVIAALGGSRTQVSGPTAAFIVILAPIYTSFGLAGLLISGLLGGLILIAMGLFRLGGLTRFIPHPVTTGFTAGIATVIATLQLKDMLGLELGREPEHFFERVMVMWEARASVIPGELAIGLLTLAMLVMLPRVTKRVPAPLVALPVAALVAAGASLIWEGFEVATIASRFQTTVGDQVYAGIPPLPPLPMLPWEAAGPGGEPFELSFSTVRALLGGALAIAMLGAIESLLSAVVADGMARTRHDPDSELIAQGVGNVVAPFFGGIPATGAIARTATNIKAGARSPVASMVHALSIVVAVVVGAPLLGFLPMASLAALLLLVAWNMSEARHFVHIVRVAPASDVAVLLTCFGLTVAVDMVIGVSVGVVLAALIFMRRMAEVTEGAPAPTGPAGTVEEVPAGVVVYAIRGPLFFGAAQKAMAALEIVSRETEAVVLELDGVQAMDATGLVALESALETLQDHEVHAVVAGARGQTLALLKRAGVAEREGVHLCENTAVALAWLREHSPRAAG